MAKFHSRLSPSGAHRWMRCPGSVAAEEGKPDTKRRESAEGTFAHEVLLDLALPFEIEPHYFIGRKRKIDGFEIECDFEMAETLLPVYDEIIGIPGIHLYETRVDLSFWIPGESGTADCGILGKNFVMIRDLKYGAGVPVHPERNEQAMAYALGMCRHFHTLGHDLRGKKIIIAIDQPRCAGGGGIWETDLKTLREFGEEFAEAGVRAKDKDAPRIPGEKQCQWCKAKEDCKPLAEHMLALAQLDFDHLDEEEPELVSPSSLSAKQRAKIIRKQKLFESWLKAVHFMTLQDALAGRPAGGLKAVYGRAPPRRWDNQERAVSTLEEIGLNPYKDPEVLSPAGAEEQIKKLIPARSKEGKIKRAEVMALIQERTLEGTPKPILVEEDDPKPQVFSADAEFDDLDAEYAED
jgi:hypothetical protein